MIPSANICLGTYSTHVGMLVTLSALNHAVQCHHLAVCAGLVHADVLCFVNANNPIVRVAGHFQVNA